MDAAGGPSADHVNLQAAVDAAKDGDTLLVKPGNYDGFLLSGKGLTVLAEYKQSFTLNEDAQVIVTDLSPAQDFVVRGAREETGLPFTDDGSQWGFQNCAGLIWIEDCVLPEPSIQHPVAPGMQLGFKNKLYAENVERLVVVRSVLQGSGGESFFSFGTSGHAGLEARDCRSLTVFESEIHAGPGGQGQDSDSLGAKGGTGLRAWGCADVFLARSLLVGGGGGDSWDENGSAGGAGGDALLISSLSGSDPAFGVTLRECELLPGVGGINLFQGNNPGPPGQTYVGASGTLVQEAGSARGLVAPTPVREGNVLRFHLDGESGDFAFLILGAGTSTLQLAGVGGVLVVEPVLPLKFVGVSSGPDLILPVAVPDLPVGITAMELPAQGLFISSTFGVVLGSTTHVTLLDAAF